MKTKFDYIILNEDNEWLSTGVNSTEKELKADIKDVQKREFDRWGEKTGIIIYKADKMEKQII